MTFIDHNEFVKLKDHKWFERQSHAGKCVANVLNICNELVVKNKRPNLNLKDLEQAAIKIIKDFTCTPTFLGYKGFPSAICVSVNNQLVHGVVNDYILQEGDLVSVDLGATFEGAIADAAYTFIYGEPKSKIILNMVKTCQKALETGINAVKIGNHLGAIGYAIHNFIKNTPYGLVDKYGGHGIDYDKPHAEPFVSNKDLKTNGIRITPGLTIAIEPMLILNKDTSTKVLSSDKWTVVANKLCCHFEHSIFVGEDKVHIITEHGMKYEN